MEFRQLRYFKAIADANSFARAAQSLRVAQPALSRSIAKLEEEIGQQLFVRHSGGVSLTDAGRRCYDHATRILSEMRHLFSDMSANSEEPRGPVSFGAPQSLQAMLVLAATARFLTGNPHCTINLMQDSSSRLREHVNGGLIDSAIIPVTTETGLHITPLVREHICLIVPADRRQQFPSMIDKEVLSTVPLLLTGYPATVDNLFGRLVPRGSGELNVRGEVNSSAMLLDLVLRGAGFGVAPASAMSQDTQGVLDYVPISSMTLSWAIATSWDSQANAAVNALEKLIVDGARSLVSEGAWATAELLCPGE